jgi:hypothetical protein
MGGTVWSEGKYRILAALLAFFLGMLGVHRFYLGDTKNGTIMLVGTIVSLLLTVIVIGGLGLLVFWGLGLRRFRPLPHHVGRRLRGQVQPGFPHVIGPRPGVQTDGLLD